MLCYTENQLFTNFPVWWGGNEPRGRFCGTKAVFGSFFVNFCTLCLQFI